MRNPFAVDLASDPAPRPAPGIGRAMAEAQRGDQHGGDDPRVTRPCDCVGERLGEEQAIFRPSGIMTRPLGSNAAGPDITETRAVVQAMPADRMSSHSDPVDAACATRRCGQTHLDIDDAAIDTAIEAFSTGLGTFKKGGPRQ